ncbi:MAG TPA: DUF2946 family protein [Alphaproteobacteria bacterium]
MRTRRHRRPDHRHGGFFRQRWIAVLGIAAILFQGVVLATHVARAAQAPAPPVHCRSDTDEAPHQGDGKQPGHTAAAVCQICLTLQHAGKGILPSAPPLPLPPVAFVGPDDDAPPTVLSRRAYTPAHPRAPPTV